MRFGKYSKQYCSFKLYRQHDVIVPTSTHVATYSLIK